MFAKVFRVYVFCYLAGIEYTSVKLTAKEMKMIQFPREGMSVVLTEPIPMKDLPTIAERATTFITEKFSCKIIDENHS